MKYNDMPRPLAKAKEPSLDTPNDQNRKNRVSETYLELMDQPKAFMKTLEAVSTKLDTITSALRERYIDTVVMIGCGDSWFVGNSLVYCIESVTGFRCVSLEAYEFITYYRNNINERTLVIGQSASGTTQSVLNGLAYAKEQGAITIGMGNTEGSTILSDFDFGIYIPVTRKGWPTQATTSAMGALVQLFCQISLAKNLHQELAGQLMVELEQIPRLMQEALVQNEQTIENFCASQTHTTYFQATGSGPSYGVAQIAAAKIKELCPAHANAYPLEEFHHYRSLKLGDTMILIAPQGLGKDREMDTALVGAYDGGVIVTIGHCLPEELLRISDLTCSVPRVSEHLSPFVYAVPVHLFAYYLAMEKFKHSIGYPS